MRLRLTHNSPELTGGARPWRPAPALKASALLHVGAAAATVVRPEVWPWALGFVAADHAVLAGAGLWPRSRLLGPNLIRLPNFAARRGEVALTIDDGPDPEVTPRVLCLLEAHHARATFFCIGERAAAHPDLCAEIVRRGHCVENHTQRHRHSFSFLGRAGFEHEIAAAQATLARITGAAPRFFRAPAGLRNPLLDPVLARLGLTLVSWSRRGFDTRNGDPSSVTARLVRALRAGDILLLHDGHAARTPAGTPVILEVLPRLLDELSARALRPVTLRAALE